MDIHSIPLKLAKMHSVYKIANIAIFFRVKIELYSSIFLSYLQLLQHGTSYLTRLLVIGTEECPVAIKILVAFVDDVGIASGTK